jgi:hypothetical protein
MTVEEQRAELDAERKPAKKDADELTDEELEPASGAGGGISPGIWTDHSADQPSFLDDWVDG